MKLPTRRKEGANIKRTPTYLKKIETTFQQTIICKEDDMYIAECPEIGTVDQGATIEQAVSNLQVATQL